MKSVGVQYLAAVRALKRDGVNQLKRTVHIMFVPDEETGGVLGMKKFVPTVEFEALNVGFSLDEGLASPTEEFPVYYAERSIWRECFMIRFIKFLVKFSSSFIFSALLSQKSILNAVVRRAMVRCC